MKYENFEQAQFVANKIKENEKLLDDLKAAEEIEIRVQLASGYHIKTIQCGMLCEKDYPLDKAAHQFKVQLISIIEYNITSLKAEISKL